MAFVDSRAQSTSSVPAPALIPSTISATPLFYRSLSAPSHMQVSELSQNGLMPGLITSPNHDYFCTPSQKSIQQHQYHTHAPIQTHSHVPQHQGFAGQGQFFAQPFQVNQIQSGPQIPYIMDLGNNGSNGNNMNAIYQSSIHPFQVDVLGTSQSVSESPGAPLSRMKFEFPNGEPLSFHADMSMTTSIATTQDMDDVQTNSSISCSPPSSSLDSSSPTFRGPFESPAMRSTGRVRSLPFSDNDLSRFELPDDFIGYSFPRHGSVGSLYPMTQSHELLESASSLGHPGLQHSHSHSQLAGTAMAPSSSSESITSDLCLPLNTGKRRNSIKPKLRRASASPDSPGRLFSCIFDDCGKLFKRSEHLKRHVRSVHTLEKPYICPVESCPKRFSRSDNLNQHIRVHRPEKDKPIPKYNFTPLHY
ncbi:hypothetical protein BGX28_007295 [Mortierella sp. GBA30]|nr:hypothetical protein BGX28_007295 [Mortierella sp. GBA30]